MKNMYQINFPMEILQANYKEEQMKVKHFSSEKSEILMCKH